VLEFDNIIDAVHGLSHEEKSKLRLLLDEELNSSSRPSENGVDPAKGIIGLFADEPELLDGVMEAVYERRSRPFRLDQ
jgi:hypothetical protein